MQAKINAYWWEGCLGFSKTLQRIAQFKSPYVRNFGDCLSPLILSLLSGSKVVHSHQAKKILALGSIFFALRDYDTVWGSGFLSALHIKYALNKCNVKYCAVRGPKTRKLLLDHGIDCPRVYGDPAILLPELITNDLKKKYRIGIVTHFSHAHLLKGIFKKDSAICLINAEHPVPVVVQQLLACDVILSTSLHGVIVAEAYGLPALFVVYHKPLHDDLFKFEDYFASTQRELFYAVSDFSKLNRLVYLATRQPAACYDKHPLLAAFPFAIQGHKKMPWSSFANLRFKTSMIPPVLRW